MRFSPVLMLASLLLTVSIPAAVPVPQKPPHPLLAQARERVQAYVAEFPDFTVSETVTRSVLISGQWYGIDRLETVVSYEHGRGETIRLVSINGQPPERPDQDVRGATAIGTVSAQLTSPFRPEAGTRFEAAGQERFRERDCLIFRYSVPRQNSDYELIVTTENQARQSAIVAFSGRIWIERDSGYVLRVEKSAEGIPENFPITDAEAVVEYGWVLIAEKRFWMPLRAETVTGYTSARPWTQKILVPAHRQTYLNVTEFRNYRKFEADVKVVD